MILMAGCGSSSKTVYIGKGTYIDAPVEGISYRCGIEDGVTDQDGTFYYELNKECQFSIGDYTFKKIKADFFGGDGVKIYEKNIGIARLLQTLDIDGDPSNGIKVLKEEGQFVAKLEGLEDEQISKLQKSLKDNINEYKGRFVTLDNAKKHLQDVEKGIENLKPVIKLSKESVRQNESITFDAQESQGEIESYEWKIDGKVIGDSQTVTIDASKLNLGSNRVVLTLSNDKGGKKSTSKTFTVLPKPTVWDNAVTLHQNADDKLLVRSDDLNLYLKFISKNMSNSKIDNLTYYINSDDSKISGTGSNGFDYKLTTEGFFKLGGGDDYNGVKVQDINTSIKNGAIEFTIKRSNIEYLAKDLEIFVFDNGSKIFDDNNKYTIPNYTPPVDKVGPVILLDKEGLQKIALNGTLPQFKATAYDVGDKRHVTVSQDKSKVDLSKPGYYTLYFVAKDSKGNESRKGINIQVGTPNSTTLIEKKMGDLSESVIIQKGLVWANDDTTSEESTRGCLVIGGGTKNVKELFEEYCQNSNYAGFTDWRAPTPLELSKYTIQMNDEGRIPGMARKHCIRTLSIENNSTVKAVSTHIIGEVDKKKKHLIGHIYDSPITPAGGRCVRGKIDNSIGDLKLGVKNGGHVIEQVSKKLMWVNEFDVSKKACLAIHYNKPEEYNASKNFCQNLNFAGFSDWRDPTSTELQSFIKETKSAHIIPGYAAPCKKLLARDDENGTVVEKEVYTRFSDKLGKVLDMNITNSNIGLRCVRDEK
jgi:hypothetical protein